MAAAHVSAGDVRTYRWRRRSALTEIVFSLHQSLLQNAAPDVDVGSQALLRCLLHRLPLLLPQLPLLRQSPRPSCWAGRESFHDCCFKFKRWKSIFKRHSYDDTQLFFFNIKTRASKKSSIMSSPTWKVGMGGGKWIEYATDDAGVLEQAVSTSF